MASVATVSVAIAIHSDAHLLLVAPRPPRLRRRRRLLSLPQPCTQLRLRRHLGAPLRLLRRELHLQHILQLPLPCRPRALPLLRPLRQHLQHVLRCVALPLELALAPRRDGRLRRRLCLHAPQLRLRLR